MPRIVTLEGVDKCGKDSVKDEIVRLSDGNVLVMCRTFISQIVYGRIYARDINENYFFEQARKFYDIGVKFIYLEASVDALSHRFEVHNEDDVPIDKIQMHIDMFQQVMFEMRNKEDITIYQYPTDCYTPAETAQMIIGGIDV